MYVGSTLCEPISQRVANKVKLKATIITDLCLYIEFTIIIDLSYN